MEQSSSITTICYEKKMIFLRNNKMFYYALDNNKAELDILKQFGSIGYTCGGKG